MAICLDAFSHLFVSTISLHIFAFQWGRTEQQQQPDFNVDGSSIPCCFLTHNGLYDATQYKHSKLHPYLFL